MHFPNFSNIKTPTLGSRLFKIIMKFENAEIVKAHKRNNHMQIFSTSSLTYFLEKTGESVMAQKEEVPTLKFLSYGSYYQRQSQDTKVCCLLCVLIRAPRK